MSKETKTDGRARRKKPFPPDTVGPFPKHWGGTPDPEECDPTPIELPAAARRPESMQQQIATAVHAELSRRDSEGFDTPEDADDFTEDDPDELDLSPYEKYFEEVIEEYEPEPEPEEDPEPEPEPDKEPVKDSDS